MAQERLGPWRERPPSPRAWYGFGCRCVFTPLPRPLGVAPEPAIRAGRQFSAPSGRWSTYSPTAGSSDWRAALGEPSLSGSGPPSSRGALRSTGKRPANGNTEPKHREAPVAVPRLGSRGNGPPARGRGGGAARSTTRSGPRTVAPTCSSGVGGWMSDRSISRGRRAGAGA